MAAVAGGGELPALVVMPLQDNDALIGQTPSGKEYGKFTFATAIPVDLSPATAGRWTQLPGGMLNWQLNVRSETARSLNLGFQRYAMPEGGELRIYPAGGDRASAAQVFTAADNEQHGQLWSAIVESNELVLDVTLPAVEREELELQVTSVNHAFRDFRQQYDKSDKIGGETSGACNIDVICNASTLPGIGASIDEYRDEIRSVGAYTLNGTDTCTGALVNNTAQDGTPYFLTADHCSISNGNAPSMVVYWNFECSFCRQPNSGASGGVADGPLNQFNSGAILRAEYAPSDMTLVELDDPIDKAFNVFYAGWDRSGAEATTAVAIHHPAVAEKRISFEFDPTTTTSYGGGSSPGDGSHVRVFDWDAGTTEPGSSGSPLFDQHGRIIGQLHGGDAACGNDRSDWYGRVSHSWAGGGTASSRLSNWLDPLGTGATTLDGRNAASPRGEVSFNLERYEVGASITVALRDSDLVAPTIAVALTTSGGDSETLLLTQTSAGSYSGTIGSAAGSVSTGNGQLEGAIGHTITAVYLDANDGAGGINVLATATAQFAQTSIAGFLWHDLNDSGTFDPGEPPVAGRIVYADLNDDRIRQAHEPFTTTNAAGEYVLEVDAGTYVVRAAQLSNWVQTFPADTAADVEPNSTIAAAQEIDSGFWSLRSEANIANSTTRPHISISGTGDNTYDYFRFTVPHAGAVGVFDIDAPTSFDTELFLFNSIGGYLTGNDDDDVDPGSVMYNSRLQYTFPTAGSYVIGVAAYNSFGQNGGITGATIPFGGNYTLHISLDGHLLFSGVNDAGHEVTVAAGQLASGVNFGSRQTSAAASVVDRHVFYNGSAFDLADAGASADDDFAIAHDKQPLFPGSAASFANYITSPQGITGIMIDLAGAPDPHLISPAADFEFRQGNSDPVGQWTEVPPTPQLHVRMGAGDGGSDRLTLIWPAGTIVGQWLEVRLKATPATGLAADDRFYFGSAPGDTGGTPGNAEVNALDYQAVRANQTNFLNPAAIDDAFDHNRDQRVNAADLLIVRDHATTMATQLVLITPPAELLAKGAAPEAVGDDRLIGQLAASNVLTRQADRESISEQAAATDAPADLAVVDFALERYLAEYARLSPRKAAAPFSSSAPRTEGDPGDLLEANWFLP